MGAAKRTFTAKSAVNIVEQALNLDYFHPFGKSKQVPIPAHWRPGKGPLCLVLGDNAGGKSFFRRIVSQICREAKVEAMGISMEGRKFGGVMSAFVYGDESWESTGHNSSKTILNGISSCRNRENPHVIYWDEPDLGLSDAWAAGAGIAIRDFAKAPGKHTRGIFVVTHSKSLVSQLLDIEPHYLHLGGDAPESLTAWFEEPVVPRKLDDLPNAAHKRFKAIQEILNRLKEKR